LAKVEILATGSPGLTFSVGWEDTCGGTRDRKHGVAGGSGGQGRSELPSPAVVVVKLPAATGDYVGCYLTAGACARRPPPAADLGPRSPTADSGVRLRRRDVSYVEPRGDAIGI
jgi:hypothetical protein